jgi:hypothetical protein
VRKRERERASVWVGVLLSCDLSEDELVRVVCSLSWFVFTRRRDYPSLAEENLNNEKKKATHFLEISFQN